MTRNSAKYPNRLRESIRQAGLTVKEVAEESGVPLRTLFDYCKGDVPIPRKKLEDIAAVLGYSPRYLVPTVPRMDLHLLQSSDEDTNYWIPTGVLNTLDTLRRDLLVQML
jgi:transcriptional regulator with XRE-family HTH domain